MGTQIMTPEELEVEAQKQGITVEELQAKLEEEGTALAERAEAEGKTVDELLAEEKELSGIIEKYGGDPAKIAKAYKSSQQEISKIIERQKTLEREKQELEQRLTQLNIGPKATPGKDAREQITEELKKRYSTLDDDVIEAMVDQRIETAMALRSEYMIDKANDRIDIEKDALKNDSYYKKYKEEIDTLINAQPLAAKLQKGMAKRCRDLVVGQHMDEIIKETKGSPNPDDTEIVGVKGPRTTTTPIGKPKGTTTSEQANQAAEMGIKPETFLAILKKHKDQAKKDGLPEPQLLTDPWRKR